mgnify:FL=1
MSELHQESLREGSRDWVLFKRIVVYLKPYQALVLLAIFFLFCVSILSLSGPYLTKIAIDDYISVSNLEGLNQIALIYLIVLVVAFVCQFIQTYLMQYIGQKVMYDLRTQTFAHMHRMSFKFFDRNPIGKLITRVVNDVEVLNEMLTSGLILVFSDLFMLVGIFSMMLYLDWQMALIVCVVFPLLYLATMAYRIRARDALRKIRAHITRLNSFLEENLSGMSTVHIFHKEIIYENKFRLINEEKVNEEFRSVNYNAIYLPSIDVFSALGMVLIIWYGGEKFVQGQIQLGIIVAFLQYLQKFYDPLRDLAEKFNIFQTAIASAERTFEFLDEPEEIVDSHFSQTVKQVRGEVEFRNVWFSYKKDEYVLRDISFSLLEGESLAVVGATGAGKSSLVNALCRFYEIQRGDILLDGIPTNKISKRDLRRQISLVQQDVFLFSGSILDNIRLGNSYLEIDQIKSIAESVNLHQFVECLPDKYEQNVLERGSVLSLGQKQLLSFARALATDPRILVLDEATSSIDTETELQVQSGIKELIRGRTSIIIAHRLSTLKNVDKILVLKEGRMAEYGTQKELLQKKGIYWKLYNLQTFNGVKL